MAFDFPASPSIGQISNGYVYNGMGWYGGPVPAAGQPTEQFVSLAGQSSVDIVVPDWAKMATIEGCIWPVSASSYSLMTLSIDGTTFYGGTQFALMGGITHNVTGGYGTQGAGSNAGFYLDYTLSNINVPHLFNCTLNVEVTGASQLYTARTEAMGYSNTSLGFTMLWSGYLNVNNSPSRAKKLRIFIAAGGGVYPANSYVKIRWSGDSAAIPQSNAIADAPADGKFYLRQNNIWVDAAPILAPMPIAPAGIGQHINFAGGVGAALYLPAGGTWSWWNIGYNPGSGIFPYSVAGGVHAGGTLTRSATASIVWSGMCWRVQ